MAVYVGEYGLTWVSMDPASKCGMTDVSVFEAESVAVFVYEYMLECVFCLHH